MDMQEDVFAQEAFGRAALKKLGRVPENFRLFAAGWTDDRTVMKVTGGEFRIAKSGPNAGKLTVLIPRTTRTVHVTPKEIAACDDRNHQSVFEITLPGFNAEGDDTDDLIVWIKAPSADDVAALFSLHGYEVPGLTEVKAKTADSDIDFTIPGTGARALILRFEEAVERAANRTHPSMVS